MGLIAQLQSFEAGPHKTEEEIMLRPLDITEPKICQSEWNIRTIFFLYKYPMYVGTVCKSRLQTIVFQTVFI